MTGISLYLSGSSKPKTVLSVFPRYGLHLIWDCFHEHLPEVDPVEHHADVTAPLLAIAAVKLISGIWGKTTAIAWVGEMTTLLGKTSAGVTVVAFVAVEDLFLEMIKCHNASTCVPEWRKSMILMLTMFRVPQMSSVEWVSGRRKPRY